MPELPEVESLRRILVRTAVGRTIVSVRIGEKRLRRRVAVDFAAAIAGRRIVKLSRRAKYLIVELDGDDVMLVHLGMSGSLTHRHDGLRGGTERSRSRAAVARVQRRLPRREGPRPDGGDQEPDNGSTNRRRYRQYLRIRDSISRWRASRAAGRPRDANRDRKNRGGRAGYPARRDRP